MVGRHARGADDDLGAVGAQHGDLVTGHLVRAGEHAPVAALLGDDRQPDAGVTGGRLDDHAARLQLALPLRRLDHAQRDAVLHRAAGVQVLDLGQHVRRLRHARGDGLQPDQRRVPHHFGQRVVDLHVALPLVSRFIAVSLERRYRLRLNSAVNVADGLVSAL